MSLRTRHFPVVAPRRHEPRWRHQNSKNTNSNKARRSVFTANYSQKVSKRCHSPSVFSHKIDGRRVSRAVSWPAADIMTNGGWRCDEWKRVLSPLYTLCYSWAKGWKQLISHGPQHYLHCSTYITLMIIKDRPGKPPAMLVKELPCTIFITLLKSLRTSCVEGSGDSIFS